MSIVEGILSWIAEQLLAGLEWLWGLLSSWLFHTPDMTALPQVAAVSSSARLAMNTAMGLIMLVIALLSIMNAGSERSRYTLKELAPRFVVGMVAVNLAPNIVSVCITAGNSLTAALSGIDFESETTVEQMRRIVAGASSDPAHLLMVIILRECLWIALAMLLLSWLGRMVLLMICAAVAPVAMAAHIFPVTEPIASAWWRAIGGAMITQVLQAVTLNMAWGTLLTTGENLPFLGIKGDATGLANLAIAAFLTFQVARIPKLVARAMSSGRGAPNILSQIVRLVLVQQAVGALRLFGRAPKPMAPLLPKPAPVHIHEAGSHQHQNVKNFEPGSVLHSHTHQQGSHQHQHNREIVHFNEAGVRHQHIHKAPTPTPPPKWRPTSNPNPTPLRVRRTPSS